jgi:hypothetical protein
MPGKFTITYGHGTRRRKAPPHRSMQIRIPEAANHAALGIWANRRRIVDIVTFTM